MADKLKQTAADEVEHVKKLAVEGIQSRTYMYPIKVRRSFSVCSQSSSPKKEEKFSESPEKYDKVLRKGN